MQDNLIDRIRSAIKDSTLAGPKHGVVISKVDAKRLLYRLVKEGQVKFEPCTCSNCKRK